MTEYKLIRYIKAINPDLIFTCNRDLYYTILAFFFLPKKIVLLGIHDYKLHSNFETNVFLRFSYWLSFHIYDNFLLYSKNQYDMFLKNYSYKNCFQTYLAAKNYGDASLKKQISYGKIRFLFFGRIDYYKGLDLLINACERLVEKGKSNFELSICGIGDYWKTCEPLISYKSIYNLQIRFIDYKEIPDLFSTHHYLVLPYRDATQSGPSMIAVNYGLPIIATNLASFKDVYSDDAAIFYDAGELESALERALEMPETDYLYMKNAAEKIKEKYSEESVSDKYRKVIDSLLNN